jgi:glycosyltransferase involved in cell wall biosynthesis
MISVSVVCATIDDPDLVARAITSIQQSASRGGVQAQVIIVDQSVNADCLALRERFTDAELLVIHSRIRGLSRSRNIGLERASGKFVMFWDADCIMDPDFFRELARLDVSHPDVDLFYGAIKCPIEKHNVFRKWPAITKPISHFYRWQISTSVNCIWRNIGKNSDARLDERFGIGSTYGSCEDVDFFIQLEGRALYSPELVIYHPDQNVNDVPVEKSRSYSFGFGALCRKHLGNYGAVYLMVTVLKKFYQILRGQVAPSTGAILIKERFRGFSEFRS